MIRSILASLFFFFYMFAVTHDIHAKKDLKIFIDPMNDTLESKSWGIGVLIGPISALNLSKKFNNRWVVQPIFVVREDIHSIGLRTLYRLKARKVYFFENNYQTVLTLYGGVGYFKAIGNTSRFKSYYDSIFTPLLGIELGNKEDLIKPYIECVYYAYTQKTRISNYSKAVAAVDKSGLSLSAGILLEF